MSSKVVNEQPINDRVRRAVESLGVSQREIGRRVGVSGAFISLVCQARSQPSVALLTGLRQEFGVSLDWLLLGQGNMMVTTTSSTPTPAPHEAFVMLAHLADHGPDALDRASLLLQGLLSAYTPKTQQARAG